MLSNVLVDTSYLFTLMNVEDARHVQCQQLAKSEGIRLLFPEVILGETTFLIRCFGGIPAVASFLSDFSSFSPTMINLEKSDLLRAKDILLQYQTAEFDFVDCCLMAISERLNIRQVCTLDRRDFSIFRPKHCDYLELLPE
jgi:uncharacterized protein